MLEATGTVTALNSVEIRPQIASTITKVHIRKASSSRAGQPLFTLDARNDEVNVTKARAQLAKDQAALADAAAAAGAQQGPVRAELHLAGRGRHQPDAGRFRSAPSSPPTARRSRRRRSACRTAASSRRRPAAPARSTSFPAARCSRAATPLVTITQLDPIAVAFSLPQRNLGDALAALRGGGGKVTAVLPEAARRADRQAAVRRQRRRRGVRHGARSRPSSPTSDERLWPGAFVTVRARGADARRARASIPQAAIIQSPRGKIVYVVDAGGKAVARPVEVRLRRAASDAAVTGVKPGERDRARRPPEPAPRRDRDRAARRRRRGARPASAARRRRLGATAAPARRRGDGGAAVPSAEDRHAMNLSELFIRRPVLTVLLNAAIVVAGVIAYRSIPVAALPSYNTPVINVSAPAARRQPGDDGDLGRAAAREAVPDDPGPGGHQLDQHARQHLADARVRGGPRHRRGRGRRAGGAAARRSAQLPARHDGAAVVPQGQPGRRAGAAASR